MYGICFVGTIVPPCLDSVQVVPFITVDFPITFDQFHQWVGPFTYNIRASNYSLHRSLSRDISLLLLLQLFYAGSIAGFYLPYDFCLYPLATALEVHGLRFIPFALGTLICATVLVISW